MASPIPIQVSFQGGGAKIVALLAAAEALQAAEKRGQVKIVRVAGTSAGSIVACLIAAEQPIQHTVQTLKDRGKSELDSLLPKRSLIGHAWRALRGQPLYDEDNLRAWLRMLFPSELQQLKDLKRPAFIVATDLLAATKRVLYSNETHGESWLSDVLVDSCALPFVFRSSSSKSSKVDGGLCENLPVGELFGGEVQHGRVLAVSFQREQPRSPRNFKDFGLAFIAASIENTVDRALEILEQDRVLRIDTNIESFDFGRALEKLGSDHYKLIREQAGSWITSLVSSGRLEPNRSSSEVSRPSKSRDRTDGAPFPRDESLWLEDVWRDSSPASQYLMRQVDRVFRRQHEPEEIAFESSTFMVIANSLIQAGAEGFGSPDEVRQIIRFRPKDADLYCIKIGLIGDTDDPNGSFLREMDLTVTDSNGVKNDAIIVPLVDSTKPAGTAGLHARQAAIFFHPVLRVGNAGEPYTIRQFRSFRGGMGKLARGDRDTIGNRNIRQHTLIGRVELVLLLPADAPKLNWAWSAGGPPEASVMTKADLDVFANQAPMGFRTEGWFCEKLPPGMRFGVDLWLDEPITSPETPKAGSEAGS